MNLTENDLHFCNGMEQSTQPYCPSCGYPASSEFDYCPKCGRKL